MVSKQQKQQKEWSSFEVLIELGEGVQAKFEENELTVTGPKGEVTKRFRFPSAKRGE